MAVCERCKVSGGQLHGLALYIDEGEDEGMHVGDVSLVLCDPCADELADRLAVMREMLLAAWTGRRLAHVKKL